MAVDSEKSAEAQFLGYLFLTVTPAMVDSGQALAMIQRALSVRGYLPASPAPKSPPVLNRSAFFPVAEARKKFCGSFSKVPSEGRLASSSPSRPRS